jgi:hypothetical protein
MEVVADGADQNLAGIEAHARLNGDVAGTLDILGVGTDGGLHRQGGVGRPQRVILQRQRGSENRHDAVAQYLVHRPFVSVHGVDHSLKDWIKKLPRLLGVAIREQLHRSFQVGEEHRDLFALAFDGGLRGEDPIGEVLWGVALG